MKNLLITLTLIFFVSFNYGQNRKTIPAVRTYQHIIIDGKLNEPAWTKAPVATNFIQNEPSNGQPSKEHTIVKVLYDQSGIYIGAILYDNHPDSIRFDLTQRDEMPRHTDAFGVLLDPYNNGLYGFLFGVTSANVQFDYKLTPNGQDFSWDAVWQSATSKFDSGWIAEIKIPYSAFRFSTAHIQNWGINFIRFIPRYQELSAWNFIDKTKPGFVEQSGLLTGIKNIKPPLRLAFMPYISAYANNSEGSWSYFIRGGMDLKYGINESFTLDMMLIPDFGQVESDDKVLNLSPFETKYVEKRQFFTEGSELFNKAGIFYSRRIGSTPINFNLPYSQLKPHEIVINNPSQTQILNATKITGRTNKGLGIGLLDAITMPTKATVLDTLTNSKRFITTQPYTNYNVFVLDQSLPQNSFLSFINTNMLAINNLLANVSAIDYRIRLFDQNYTISGISSISSRKPFHQNTQNGFRNEITFEKSKGNLLFGFNNRIFDTKYNINDLGYLRHNNFITTNLWLSYQNFKKNNLLLNWQSRLRFQYTTLYQNLAFTEENISCSFSGMFKNYWTFYFGGFYQPKNPIDWYDPRIWGRFYKGPKTTFIWLHLSTNSAKPLFLGIGGHVFFAKQHKHGFAINTNLNLRMSNKFNINYQFNYDIANRYGYVKAINFDTIYYGFRHQQTITNTIVLKYIFTNKAGLRFRLRHYWSLADYKTPFYFLNPDGTLSPSNFSTNANINFNAFTIDLTYTWNFAPGSQLTLMWKNQILNYSPYITYNFINNLENTISSPQNNSFSIKILYYLDWSYFHKNVRPKIANTLNSMVKNIFTSRLTKKDNNPNYS